MTGRGEDPRQADALEQQFRTARAGLVAWFRRRIGDPVEAEDLCQECFLRIGTRGADAIEDLDAYFYRTARSVLADRRRRRAVREADAHIAMAAEGEPSRNPDPLHSLLAREQLEAVSVVLAGMPERTRAVFVLCRLEGARYAEIATRLGISISAVQNHMLRAIDILLAAGESA